MSNSAERQQLWVPACGPLISMGVGAGLPFWQIQGKGVFPSIELSCLFPVEGGPLSAHLTDPSFMAETGQCRPDLLRVLPHHSGPCPTLCTVAGSLVLKHHCRAPESCRVNGPAAQAHVGSSLIYLLEAGGCFLSPRRS